MHPVGASWLRLVRFARLQSDAILHPRLVAERHQRVHLHSLLLDGVYADDKYERRRLREVKAPDRAELQYLVEPMSERHPVSSVKAPSVVPTVVVRRLTRSGNANLGGRALQAVRLAICAGRLVNRRR